MVGADEFFGLEAAVELVDMDRTEACTSSAIKMLTNAYSMSEANTNTVHEDMKMSMALMYETGGNDFCD